jgi:hypothetical protein
MKKYPSLRYTVSGCTGNEAESRSSRSEYLNTGKVESGRAKDTDARGVSWKLSCP